MDQAMKERWITALRSGKYPQGRGELVTAEGNYCCLGVLCVVEGVEIPRDTMTSYLPKPLDTVFPGRENLILSDMNDKGQSFAEIADWIEINL